MDALHEGESPPNANGQLKGLTRRKRQEELASPIITPSADKGKWISELWLAIDAVSESQSGDLGLVARNLVEVATQMLSVASEIRRRLRQ